MLSISWSSEQDRRAPMCLPKPMTAISARLENRYSKMETRKSKLADHVRLGTSPEFSGAVERGRAWRERVARASSFVCCHLQDGLHEFPEWRWGAVIGAPWISARAGLEVRRPCQKKLLKNEVRSHQVIEKKQSRFGTNPISKPILARTKPTLAGTKPTFEGMRLEVTSQKIEWTQQELKVTL